MYSIILRQQLTLSAKDYSKSNGLSYNTGLKTNPSSAILFDKTSDNFHSESWKSIRGNPAYFSRTKKAHSQFDKTNPMDEMQSSNSSDALLMNVFCHPKIDSWKGVKQLLQVKDLGKLKFGYHPGVNVVGGKDKTEVDLFIQDGEKKIFCESKLTETDFVFVSPTKLAAYKNLSKVFEVKNLPAFKGDIANYQLVRNILAADEFNAYFYLFIDARRPDLAKSFYQTVRCIKDIDLRMRCEIFYWQDIAAFTGKNLQAFLNEKYGL